MDEKAELELVCLGKAGLSLQQNNVKLIRELKATWHGEKASGPVVLRLSSEPEFFPAVERFADTLPSGRAVEFTDAEPVLSHDYLSSISERVQGCVRAELFLQTSGELLAKVERPVAIHPKDEWFGGEFMPELLAAFVTPNDDALVPLLHRVAELKEARGGGRGLDGYQSGSRDIALLTAKCIYDAVLELAIVYSEPPASFGVTGQRIRTVSEILSRKFATCLDLALLFASLLEACGLHPLIFLTKGHAFTGCHLADTPFPDTIGDDVQAIRKRVALNELAVFETTCATKGGSRFTDAMEIAGKHLEKDDEFEFALDVRQSRLASVRPLSSKKDTSLSVDGDGQTIPDDETLPSMENAPLPENTEDSGPLPPRVALWRSKLLDFSRRNRLLNFKDCKQSVPLAFHDLAEIENHLFAGTSFSVLPKTKHIGSGGEKDFILEEWKAKRLHAAIEEKDLNRRLLELFRAAKNDLEESGINTLFLAIGFLKWKDGTGVRAEEHKAPLILLPVQLIRKSVQSGFILSRSDDDTTVNITLLEMAKREFGLDMKRLANPPEDDNGLDVSAILRIVREDVKDMPGWEVCEELWLGRFSFNKFVMWEDLGRRLDDLRRNKTVNALIEGKGDFSDGIEPVSPQDVDTCVKPEELFCPMSADSSQLAAVLSAVKGKSFVLHGPPGSGKSQTITNLIAACLAAGKTVLFVAEKRAALEVVQRRLRRIGLGPFCLELHSNKAGKAEVLAQFKETLEFPGWKEPEEWTKVSAELAAEKQSLSGYVRAIHKEYACGLSPWRAMSWLFAHGEEDERAIRFVPKLEGLSFGDGEFDAAVSAVNALVAQGEEIAPELFDAFVFCRVKEWSPEWEEDAAEKARTLKQTAETLAKEIRSLQESLGLRATPVTQSQAEDFSTLQSLFADTPLFPEKHFSESWPTLYSLHKKHCDAAFACQKTEDEFTEVDFSAVSKLDIPSLRQRWRANRQSFALIRFFKQRALLKRLGLVLKDPAKSPFREDNLQEWFDRFEQWQDDAKCCGDPQNRAKWAAEAQLLEAGQSFWQICQRLKIAPDTLAPFLEGAKPRPDCSTLPVAMQAYRKALAAFKKTLAGSETPQTLQSSQDAAATIAANRRELRRWTLWNRTREDALALNLSPIVVALEKGELAFGNAELALRKRYCEALCSKVISETPELRDFLGEVQDKLVSDFAALDDDIAELAQREIVAKLSANLPAGRGGDCPAVSEIGILKRECEKKSRHKPVRTLLASIPNLLPKLKPCFLMSPLSVAQYLPPDGARFDIVVFDEASQITVPDAIGVIARGEQCVIVGDPMQLPPTTFFQRQADNGDEETVSDADIRELESILDECKASGMAEQYLQWHYRSRHESLIAFSNRHYYGNRLYTFPSATGGGERLGVSFRFIERGVYDRCKTRTNPEEAKAVVAAVVERMLDPACAKKSTGVVTFSEAQQRLIEDLMDKEREKHPEIEAFFDDSLEEPFFVKNLENVQGDERDAIFFSVCYGRDKDGKFAMNFGPLNRSGGERRLNVAVTRAKEQVVVFASVHASDIDLSRTQATGAAHLRAFLDYAERGVSRLGVNARSGDTEDGRFESEVAEFLRMHGYKVETQVGCSAYRVDIGVRSRVKPGDFAIGVECDGANYRDAASVRDRDKLRRGVLEGLGWRVYRVWAADWWFDREAAQSRLLAEVEAAVEGKPSPSASGKKIARKKKSAPVELAEDEPSQIYETAPCKDLSKQKDKFNLLDGPPILQEEIRRIVAFEGPITETLLRKRIMKEWGFAKLKANMEDVLRRSIPTSLPVTEQAGTRVFWPEGISAEDYATWRVPGEKRDMDEIPYAEIRNAAGHIVKLFGDIPRDALFAEVLKRFGFQRVTSSARTVLEDALKDLA